MNPPEFHGSRAGEDPQMFVDEIKKITQIMHMIEEESMELASYQLKDVAYDWVQMWNKGRKKDTAPMTWQLFQDAFLDRFFPLELREAKIEEFMNLRQGSMSVKEYCLKFNQLSKYAPNMMADSRTSMSKFLTGVSSYVMKECRSAMINREIDLPRLMIHAQQIEEDKSKDMERSNKRFRIGSYNFSQAGSQGGNRSHHSQKNSAPVPSSASVSTPNFGDVSHGGAPGSKAQGSESRSFTNSLCAKSMVSIIRGCVKVEVMCIFNMESQVTRCKTFLNPALEVSTVILQLSLVA